MGGKTKHVQRTKNNVKPSSSSRSAELLGNSTPSFVGFSVHSDMGLVPLVPGFALTDKVTDSYEANNIGSELQVILKKLAKKDPTTKRKALQELIEHISSKEREELTSLLPVWPSYYQKLAVDAEHTVRETTQETLKLLMAKCKRDMAPYLKQIVPTWLLSQFDKYGPAALVARQSFEATFARPARQNEVLDHCQKEIMEFCKLNLTFHTPDTLSAGKCLAPEDAEQKYQRLVLGSLKSLTFFVKSTAATIPAVKLPDNLLEIIFHAKFMTFAKNKLPAIKGAWFELVEYILMTPDIFTLLGDLKPTLVNVALQNIQEQDALVAPHVWSCLLLLQAKDQNWYKSVDVKKLLLSKLSPILRNLHRNSNNLLISRNLLPLISHITPECLGPTMPLTEFDRKVFNDLMEVIIAEDNTSYEKYNNIISAYFECLRYRYSKLSTAAQPIDLLTFWSGEVLETFILRPINHFLNQSASESGMEGEPEAKHCVFFNHTADLVGFWTDRRDVAFQPLYGTLLEEFWKRIFDIIDECIKGTNCSDVMKVRRMVKLVESLYKRQLNKTNETASPSVSFSQDLESEQTLTHSSEAVASQRCIKVRSAPTKISRDLKSIAKRLVLCCFEQIRSAPQLCISYAKELENLTTIFCVKDFFLQLANDGLITTCKHFSDVLRFICNVHDDSEEIFTESDGESINSEICDSEYSENKENGGEIITTDMVESVAEIMLNIIFNVLKYVDRKSCYAYIEEDLLGIHNNEVSGLLMQRLLSYPYCMDVELRQLMHSQVAIQVLYEIASDAINFSNKDKLKIIEKCFFQDERGDIIIETSTVDHLLQLLSDPLVQTQSPMTESCCSFISQITSLICGSDICSDDIKYDIFMKLWRFSVEQGTNDDYLEDVHIEVSSAWQDLLSSGDIKLDDNYLKACAAIIHRQPFRVTSVRDQFQDVFELSKTMAKFALSYAEQFRKDSEDSNLTTYMQQVDRICKTFFGGSELQGQNIQLAQQHCVLVESIREIVTPTRDLGNALTTPLAINGVFQRTFVNISAIVEMITGENLNIDNDDYLLPQVSEFLLDHIILSFKIAGIGESLLEHAHRSFVQPMDSYIFGIVERILHVVEIKYDIIESLMLKAMSEQPDEAMSRAMLYMLKRKDLLRLEENASIVMMARISEYLLPKGALTAYTQCLQYLSPLMAVDSVASLGNDPSVFTESELWTNAAIRRCHLQNMDLGEVPNEKHTAPLVAILAFLKETHKHNIKSNDDQSFCSQIDLMGQSFATVMGAVEYIHLSTLCVYKVPYLMDIENWDAVRVGMGAGVSRISRALDNYSDPKILLFMAAIYKLYAAFHHFMYSQAGKSSTILYSNVIDEWQRCFARDVNTVLYNSFYKMSIQEVDKKQIMCMMWHATIFELAPCVERLDFKIIYESILQSGNTKSTDHINFWLSNLDNPNKDFALTSFYIVQQLTPFFVTADSVELSQSIKRNEDVKPIDADFHFLMRFRSHLEYFQNEIEIYLQEFTFKLTEISNFLPFNKEKVWAYLLLSDLIIDACSHASLHMRIFYNLYLFELKWIEKFVHFLFRAMPADILRNYDSNIFTTDLFVDLSWEQIKDDVMTIEKYACHLYMKVLKKLPAAVRKWWNSLGSRQITFVDKFTQKYVSTQICNDELRAVSNLKHKQENMQVNVHMSTREVIGLYTIDEARMELVITLDSNYPLGSMKVECGKNIGGRSLSHIIAKRLTVFLTLQNGTIYDGLCKWKDDLDKKFQGVEECFICYMVIHQETCQLPKLTCKTCHKKYHGPCLYKWFTSSSKSTCPMCRSIF